jgi:hypothetical protein
MRLTPVVLIGLLAACGGGSNLGPSSNVASLTISLPSTNVTVGQTVQLTASVLDASGNPLSGHTVTWASSAPAVLSVSATGLVTAAAEGQATITASTAGKSGATTLSATYPYRDVRGTWQLSALFDGLTSAQASVTGNLVLSQTNRLTNAVTGSATLTTNIGGQVSSNTEAFSGTLTTDGVLTFVLGAGTTWTFSGTFTGSSANGRHTLTDGVTAYSGPWQATRTGASVIAAAIVGSRPASASSFGNVLRDLRR